MCERVSETKNPCADFKCAILELEEKMHPLEDSEATIKGLLRGTAKFYGADRAFVIEADWEAGIDVNTYEWCAEGIKDRRTGLRYLEIENFPTWLSTFQSKQAVILHDMKQFQEQYPTEFAFLSGHGVTSLLATPFYKRISQGYIGVDDLTRYIDAPSFLYLISFAIVLELNEIKLEREVRAATRQLSRVTKFSDKRIPVNPLGGLEITGPKEVLTDEDWKANQCYALLAYLILNHGSNLSLDKLYEVIRPYETSDSPYQVVKNVVYRIRRQLQAIGLYNMIVAKGGSF